MHFPPTIPCHPPKFLNVRLGISREFFFSTLMRICLPSCEKGKKNRKALPDANYAGLDRVVEFNTIFPDWLQAPSDSPANLFDGIPLPVHDANYAGVDRVEFNTILSEWLQVPPSVSQIPPPCQNANYDQFNTVFPNWLQAPSDSRNEEIDPNWDWDRELKFANKIPSVAGTQIIEVTGTVPPVAAADSAASPRNNNPNGRTSCTYEGCFKTFGRPADFRRHLKKHNPDCLLRCRQCHYTNYRKDKLREHQNKRHGGTVSIM